MCRRRVFDTTRACLAAISALEQRADPLLDALLTLDADRDDLVAGRPHAGELQKTLLAEHSMSIVGQQTAKRAVVRFPRDLGNTPIVLPARGSTIRSAFDALVGRARS